MKAEIKLRFLTKEGGAGEILSSFVGSQKLELGPSVQFNSERRVRDGDRRKDSDTIGLYF